MKNPNVDLVSIGDKFYDNGSKHKLCEVVDIYEMRSTKTGEIVGHKCMAKRIGGFTTNTFEVTFICVLKNKTE